MNKPTMQLTLFTHGDFDDQDQSLLDAFFALNTDPALMLCFWPHPGAGRGYAKDAEAELVAEMATYGLQRFPSWGLVLAGGERVGRDDVLTLPILKAWINSQGPPP